MVDELVDVGEMHDVTLGHVHVEGATEALDGVTQDHDGGVRDHREPHRVVPRLDDVRQPRDGGAAGLGDMD